jgi:lipid-A-disaccharide synthase
MVSAGEVSGEAMALALSRELRRQSPGTEVAMLQDTVAVEPVFGFWEGLRAAPRVRKALVQAEEFVVSENPDLVVLVSFSGFHLPLGTKLRRRGFKVLYLGPPQVWAWGGWRVRRLKAAADRVVCLFGFEESRLAGAGIDAEYLGYPLLDMVAGRLSWEQVHDRLGVGYTHRYMVFLPGSRPGEIAFHRPLFRETFLLLRKEVPALRGVVVTASGPPGAGASDADDARDRDAGLIVLRPDAGKGAGSETGKGREGRAMSAEQLQMQAVRKEEAGGRIRYEVMRHADCACAVSGTVTAELAILGVPMVCCYHLSGGSRLAARLLVKTDCFSLPNILLKRRVVPEVVDPEPEMLVRMLTTLTSSSPERREQLQALEEVRGRLGPEGAMERVARFALGMGGHPGQGQNARREL